MRVLITGGYGCIGSWVAKHLVETAVQVAIFDRQQDLSRLRLLLDEDALARVRFLAGDVAEPREVLQAVDESGATHLLHLAGLQVPTCRADPLLGARVNVIGTLAVFEAALARREQVQRVVYASSAAVHGPAAPGDSPVADQVRLAPVTHYGAFKVANELNARVYWLDHSIPSIGLRPWTVYGVGRDFGVTSEPTKAIKAVAVNRPYAITYGGRQDMQFAGDVAAAFVRALDAPFEGAETFNVRGDVVDIELFLETLARVAPAARSLITHGTRQLPTAPDLDDTRLQHCLGPVPLTTLESGIRQTYERFRALDAAGKLDLSDLG